MSDWVQGVYEDPTKLTIAILAVSAVASFFLYRHFENMIDPLKNEMTEALE